MIIPITIHIEDLIDSICMSDVSEQDMNCIMESLVREIGDSPHNIAMTLVNAVSKSTIISIIREIDVLLDDENFTRQCAQYFLRECDEEDIADMVHNL